MPSLDWIGKKAVLNHHKEVPFHLLRCDLDLSAGEPAGQRQSAGWCKETTFLVTLKKKFFRTVDFS
jgi:hypothetical protein